MTRHQAPIARIFEIVNSKRPNWKLSFIIAVQFSLLFSATSVFGQYLPTLEPDKTWAVSGYYFQFDHRNMYEISLGETVLVDNLEYTTLLVSSDDFWSGKFGLIREDTTLGQVWFRSYLHYAPDDYVDISEEVLVADYSLEIGDEFEYTYFLEYWDGSYETYTVNYEVIATGMIDGRRYIELNSLDPDLQYFFDIWTYYIIDDFESPVASMVPLRFIEGIGPSFSFVSQCAFFEVYSEYPLDPYVLCANMQDTTIWQDPFVSECYYVDQLPFVNTSMTEINLGPSIYPNPVRNQLFVYWDSKETLVLEVFNPIGQKVMSGTSGNAPTHVFDFHDLPKGVYVVHFRYGTYNYTQLIQKL